MGRTRRQAQGPRARAQAAAAGDLHPSHGVRDLFAAYDLGKDKLYGHINKTKTRTKFLGFCRYLRSLYPPEIRIAIVVATSPRT